MFKKAVRAKTLLKMAITGPTGSGKTYSALLIASGLGKKIAVLDTENGSASLYASNKGLPEFDVLNFAPPYHTDRYLKAIEMAAKAGYEVLIIDSISHQWSGEGGILDRKDQEVQAKPGTNSYTIWSKYTPEHERFKTGLLHAPLHIIATMRSKMAYVMEDNGKGKQAPKKVGLEPIQRDQFEYEFSLVIDLSTDHIASASKDRTSLFDGTFFKPSKETGLALKRWLEGSEPETTEGVVANDNLQLADSSAPSVDSYVKKYSEAPPPATVQEEVKPEFVTRTKINPAKVVTHAERTAAQYE